MEADSDIAALQDIETPLRLQDIEVLLRLQLEWGADEALDPEPVDRLPAGGLRTSQAAAVKPLPAPAAAGVRGTPAERAVALADQAEALEMLRETVRGFDGCGLRDTASHLVFATGDPAAGLLLIGEPPAADEDRAGTPFAGTEGALLDKMLASIGLDRAGLLLTPLIPWRPPGGRPPTSSELTVCLPFLHRLIVLANPQRVVLLGGLTARTLLGAAAGRRRSTMGWMDLAIPGLSQPVPALSLPSLAMLLTTPALKRDAWAALRLLRRTLNADAERP